jgi:uncharacterized membrane protein YphA (DoxX/SURF4 family)
MNTLNTIIMVGQKTSKTLHVILWFIQILLSITFIWSGAMKIFKPDELPWSWIKESPALAMITGVIDLLAGFGLVLPAMLRIYSKLTIYAAYGTILLMIAASIFHVSRGEGSQIGFNIFVLVCAIFIAWGRQTRARITDKG